MGIYIALGANLGDRRANLTKALQRLEPDVHVEAVSALYESLPQAPAPPPAYLNAACRVSTALEPQALLAYLKRIEREMGRENAERWAPRPIDLDIALYDNRLLDEGDLVIPHPRLAERAFVLRPLLDLDPELMHPATGERLADLLAKLGEEGLVQVEGSRWQIFQTW
jgi:2-amino-4-hydroxy-6-hydroxymethyldihydropteridine diphosphokinase